MNKQFKLIDECLQVLRRCNIPSMQKLRLEVQLFRIKLLLLSDNMSRETKCSICSEGTLLEVYNQLVVIDGKGSGAVLEAVTTQLRQIEIHLSRAEVAERSM